MAEVLTAKVGAVSQKNGGICIDDVWYNTSNAEAQGLPNVNRGDTVAFKWKKGKNAKGQVGNMIVSKITVKEKAPEKKEWKGKGKGGGFKGGFQKDQASIERQNSLAHATALVAATMNAKSNPEKAAELVVKIASEILLPYTQQKAEAAPKKEESFEEVDKEEEESFEDVVEEEESFDDVDDDDMPY